MITLARILRTLSLCLNYGTWGDEIGITSLNMNSKGDKDVRFMLVLHLSAAPIRFMSLLSLLGPVIAINRDILMTKVTGPEQHVLRRSIFPHGH